MKKVINITLGSIVFAIDQVAYDALASYLEQIKSNLTDSDDIKEIIDDVENAIAEKFIALKRSEKMAVTLVDVEAVMSEMGSPIEFGMYEERSGVKGQAKEHNETSDEPKKRLYRDSDDAIIAGIASGLASYFGIDPVIVRLIFVVSSFFNGLGLLAYIILWLVVPVAETTADKYAMRGERVTLRDISERVKKNIENIQKIDDVKTKGAWFDLRNFLEKMFGIVGTIVKFVTVLIRYIAGIVLIIGGALGIAGIVSLFSVILLSDKVPFPVNIQIVLETLQGSTLGIVAIVSSGTVMLVPLIVLVVVGAGLLAKHTYFTVQKSVTLAVVWIIAVILAGTTSALQVEQVMQKIGPIEGHFGDSSFEVQWKNGVIYGDDHSVRFINEDMNKTR